MPCTPARARQLLKNKEAVIHRRFPFVIRLKRKSTHITQPTALKIDPGSTVTGLAIVRIHNQVQHVLFTAELTHRRARIHELLSQRKAMRRGRHSRNGRYRADRHVNRGNKKEGWLPPSTRHLLETTSSWVNRLRAFAPISAVAVETVKFDTHRLQNPEVNGVDYQRGPLWGAEIREYLQEKWGHQCAYCGKSGVLLQIEHIVPRARGGSDRESNLTLACVRCNTAKGDQDVRQFLANDPDRLMRIMSSIKVSLAGASALNSTRFSMVNMLESKGLIVEQGSGFGTKLNRVKFGLLKTHAVDAACVGVVDKLFGTGRVPLGISAMGRGSRKRTRLNAFGFPRGYLSPSKSHFGFKTGDIVRAVVPKGVHQGTHVGRVAVRATGSFDIQMKRGKAGGIGHRFCTKIQAADGYAYSA
jgi:5-methylcytosine-specific restriction endonuclease McrA